MLQTESNIDLDNISALASLDIIKTAANTIVSLHTFHNYSAVIRGALYDVRNFAQHSQSPERSGGLLMPVDRIMTDS